MLSTPDEPLRLAGTSDGARTPAGEYLVTIWPDGGASLAWREAPSTALTWSAPVELEVAP